MKTKFHKILSILLAVSLLFTAAGVSAIAGETTDEAITVDYYVQSPGYAVLEAEGYAESTDKGDGTLENPAHTVADLVAIIGDSLTANDTVNVHIMQRDDWNVYYPEGTTSETDPSILVGKVDSVSQTPYHSITSWSNTGSAPASHDYKMVVKAYRESDADTDAVYLTYHTQLGSNKNLVLAGSTVFEDITLVCQRKSGYQHVITNGNKLTFEQDCTYGHLKNLDFSSTKTYTWDGIVTSMGYTRFMGYRTTATELKGFDVTIKNAYSASTHFYFPAYYARSKNATVSGDINVTVDNADAKIPFVWGITEKASTNTYTIPNININVKSATAVTNAVGNGNVAVSGGLQVIVPDGFEYDISALTNLKATDTDGDDVDETAITNKFWLLKNTSQNKDIITFATGDDGNALTGKYNVASGYTAIATDAQNNVYKSENGVLNLSEVPGTYTITFEKGPVTKDYYVRSSGHDGNGIVGDGRTKDKPAATVADVVATIIGDDMVEGDTANVYILQDEDGYDKFDNTATYGETGYYKHNMTAWTDNGGSIPEHKFTMVINGDPDATGTTYLADCSYVGRGTNLTLGGPTVFNDVTLICTKTYNDRPINANGYSVTFSADTGMGEINISSTANGKNWDGTTRERSIGILLANTAKTIEEPMTVVLNNNYTLSGTARRIGMFIASKNAVATEFEEDVNIIIDNAKTKMQFNYGGANVNASATFKKSLNINIKNAASVGVNTRDDDNKDGNTGAFTVTNGLQIIYPSTAAFADITSVLAAKGVTNYWILSSDATEEDMISFVTDAETGDTIPGKYAIAEGATAVAADSEGNVVAVSDDGVLDLTGKPGTYQVRFVEQYDNDGSTITVYEAGEIDLATVSHEEIEGKIFTGWAFADGTYPAQIAEYAYGDVLTAQYVDYTTEDFAVEMTEMRDDSTGDTLAPVLRFVFSENKALAANMKEVTRGALMLPTSSSYGVEMYLGERIIKGWNYDDDGNNFTPNSKELGATPTSIELTNILEETEDTLKYTLCLTNLAKENYDVYYAVRPYIQYKDNNGVEGIFYADQDVSSLYKTVAEADYDALTESEKATVDAIIEYVEVDRVAEFWTSNGLTEDGYITEDPEKTQYFDTGCGCYGEEDCTHKAFRIGDMRVADVTINTGLDIEPTQIGFVTDTHFGYPDKTDIAEKNDSLGKYSTRGDMRKGLWYYSDKGLMKFVSLFKNVVHGGDVMDYIANGGLNAAQRLIAKQSVNGSIIMAVGNHDSALYNGITQEEHYKILDTVWVPDTRYASKIISNSNNEANVMIISLDNSNRYYWESQIQPLTEDIAYAKANNIPVLIFQHRPLRTMNPAETEFKYLNSWYNASVVAPQDDSYYDISDKGVYTIKEGYMGAGKEIKIRDFTSETDWTGYDINDVTTTVYDLIRQNADIVKGVITGHIHAYTSSEIIGIDENGEPNGLTIPQYTGYSGMGAAMRITVK